MKKGWIITAVVLVIAGAALFMTALVRVHFDWSKLGTAQYETKHYMAEGAFNAVAVETDETDITFEPSGNENCIVICTERTNVRHSVTVENGTLQIKVIDERRWFDHINIFGKSLSMTVFLPQSAYDALTVQTDTGDVTVPASFSFGSIDIKTDTGDVDCRASAAGAFKIKTSTGDIKIAGVQAASVELTVSTGDIDASDLACTGDIAVTVSTGDATLTGVTCRCLTSRGDTGDLTLKNVRAEETFDIQRDTGDVCFDGSDAAEITVKTDTGDVTGTLASAKIFTVNTSTGHIRVPESTSGGICRVTTSTGDVKLSVAS